MVTHQPGGVATGTAVGIKPDNYLVLSIVSIFCFCWLFGLIALLYSLQVRGRKERENWLTLCVCVCVCVVRYGCVCVCVVCVYMCVCVCGEV